MTNDAATSIAIIGAGNVGSRLGKRLTDAGFKVVFGVREPKSSDQSNHLAPAEAARRSDVLFLTVPAGAAVEAASALGDLRDKIVVDCTNPLRFDNGPVWTPPSEGSQTAALAARLPGVTFVKGFNHFGAEVHENPIVNGVAADAYFAGDNGDAKARIMAIAARAGFRPFDAGPLRNAALLENMAVLWIHLATSGLGRHFAFRAAGAGAG